MRKGFYLSTVLVCLGLAVVVLLPATPVVAQDGPPAAENDEPLAFGTLTFDEDADEDAAPGTCTFTCPDGATHTTNASSVIQCACDCASVCGVTCTVGGRTCSPGAAAGGIGASGAP